jgi:hypothetical protein
MTANRPRLLSLLKNILTDYKCVTDVCDKRYLLLLMFLDYAVEPFYYERGLDIYEDGQNYALESLLSPTGPTLLGPVEFHAMLSAFPACRQREDASDSDELGSIQCVKLAGRTYRRRWDHRLSVKRRLAWRRSQRRA